MLHRLSINRSVRWAGMLGLVALAAVLATTSRGQTPGGEEPRANGGARQWIAFEPVVSVAPEQQRVNILRVIQIANTSTATNSVTVTLERSRPNPDRIPICTRTLQPGQQTTCGATGRESRGFADGYYQIRATQPVLPGGWIDLPVADYEERGSGNSIRLASRNRGILERIPLDWREGCPPRRGSGCPSIDTVIENNRSTG